MHNVSFITVHDWAEEYLEKIIRPRRRGNTSRDITEIMEMFTEDNDKNYKDLKRSFESVAEEELCDIKNRLHASARKWMTEVFYQLNNRTRHPAQNIFEG